MEWYIYVIKNYAMYQGRATRTEYWMFVLFNFLFSLAIGFVEGVFNLPQIFSGLYAIAVLVPGICVAIRRLHDTGKSGWWLLIGLIPFAGAIVLIVFFCQKSDAFDNMFGPHMDPKTPIAI